MTIAAAIAAASRRAVTRASEPATLQRGVAAPVAVAVVLSEGVERIGDYGQVIGQRTHAAWMRAAFAPLAGDMLTVRGITRAVEAIVSDDGLVVEVALYG